jgi:hypothetical protein
MAVLWCGGEDIDFPNGIPPTVVTTSGTFRAGFGRCSLSSSAGLMRSMLFPSGSVTSAWLTFYCSVGSYGDSAPLACGLCASGSSSGIFVGFNAGTGAVSLNTFDGTTTVTLATSAANYVLSGSFHRFDVQVSNYGASGTVTVYVDGAQILTYTGNIAVSGVASLGSVGSFIAYPYNMLSEFIVADEPTLGWQGLVTLAPNGNGATQNWTNPAYTNINPITIDDANSAYVNTTGQDEQTTDIAIPGGSFAIKAVKVVARASATAGAASTNLKLGFNNGSTVAVNPSHAVSSAFEPYEDYFTLDPTTGAAWTTLTGYQLDLRSA